MSLSTVVRDAVGAVASLSWLQLFGLGIASFLGFLASLYIYLYVYSEWAISYGNLPGPDREHWLVGNLLYLVTRQHPTPSYRGWADKYGATGRVHGFLGSKRVYTVDPVAISHITQHPDQWPKSQSMSIMLRRMLGDGLVTVEGYDHRRQRRLLNPAFSSKAVREMAPIFYDRALALHHKFTDMLEDGASTRALLADGEREKLPKDAGAIDVGVYTELTTLDVIGQAGFDYEFESLTTKKNELLHAFHSALKIMQKDAALSQLQNRFPIFDALPTPMTKLGAISKATMNRVGDGIVNDKTRIVKQIGIDKETDLGTSDLLSRLIHANLDPALTAGQKMSHDEVQAQICTFLFAGSETTGIALTWALYRLAMNPAIQTRLRQELQTIHEDQPDVDTLHGLPYLEKFTREVLRMDSPVPVVARECVEDTVLPLGTPVVGRDGKLMDKIFLNKGTEVALALNSVNRDPAIWGADAEVFNPDRYDNAAIPTAQVPGIYGNLMTFLGGPRNCIGWRFALAEFKIILFVLLRSFSFAELPSKPPISTETVLGILRSRVIGKDGVVVPLVVRPLSSDDA
ncbi:hypothetical protein Q8F55_006399 [Vanrija albida]|uniref:Cytochrome P450 n=1 Tax=Vanrija albida TaxID=181172 RepID=A0ABR3PX15_9TREE